MFLFFNYLLNATSNSSGRRAPRRKVVSLVFVDISMEVLEMRQKIQFWAKKKTFLKCIDLHSRRRLPHRIWLLFLKKQMGQANILLLGGFQHHVSGSEGQIVTISHI